MYSVSIVYWRAPDALADALVTGVSRVIGHLGCMPYSLVTLVSLVSLMIEVIEGDCAHARHPWLLVSN